MPCVICGFKAEEILITIDDGKRKLVFCPNHVLQYILGMLPETDYISLPSEQDQDLGCHICGSPAIFYRDSDVEFHLCSHHLEKLLKRNLSPMEFRLLSKMAPKGAFILHDDFYDKNRYALQPIE